MAETLRWGGTTPVSDHDPNNFRYTVHAVTAEYSLAEMTALEGESFSEEEMLAKLEYNPDEDQDYENYCDLAETPERVNERNPLFASLIDRERADTYTRAGLIIGFPESAITYVSNDDLAIPTEEVPEPTTYISTLNRVTPVPGIVTPEELLDLTDPEICNEICINTSLGDSVISLDGFFVKTPRADKPWEARLNEQMRAHAQRLALPLVEL